MVHAVVLVGVVVVMPLVFGGWLRWSVVGAAVAVSFLVPVGAVSAVVASVWLLVALLTALRTASTAVRASQSALRDGPSIAALFAAAFGVVAATAFLQSRAGLTLFGIGEPIVELTAVHFTYAGVGAVTLAGAVLAERPGARPGWSALLATIAAPPIVALGFILTHPLPQVGGAVLMSVGVLLTAALQLCSAWRRDVVAAMTGRRALLMVSGLAPWVPMGLAVAWAASNYWDVPALSIPDMARTHGVVNVVFVVAGLLARRAPAGQDVVPDPAAPAPAAAVVPS